MIDYSKLAFIDCETTGLDADRHEIWEVGLIVDGLELEWLLPVDVTRADPIALDIGRFHQRHPQGNACPSEPKPATWREPREIVETIARKTHGRHIVGAVPSFDEERLRKLLHHWQVAPSWHYHLIDVEALAVGYLANARYGSYPPAREFFLTEPLLPWDSKKLSAAVGVDPAKFRAHEALEDARWAKAIYESVME